MNKNTLALIYTGIIAIGFFIAGIFDVLDYIIIKVLLFVGFIFFVVYIAKIILKDIKNKNHLD